MKLLKFYADWCNPCKQQTIILKDNAETLNNLPIEAINIEDEENQEIVEKHGVRGLPTLVLLDKEDNVLARFSGLTTADKIIEELSKHTEEQ